jgi:hypothetical protein
MVGFGLWTIACICFGMWLKREDDIERDPISRMIDVSKEAESMFKKINQPNNDGEEPSDGPRDPGKL